MKTMNKTHNRPGFMLYFTAISMFDYCTDEQAGKLIKACFHYALTGNYPTEQLFGTSDNPAEHLDPVIEAYFQLLKDHLDRDQERYEEIVKERIAAGKRGGIAKARNASKSEVDYFCE